MRRAFTLRRAAAAVVTAVALVFVLATGLLLLGYRVSPVLTGSMSPTYRPGDAIVTRTVPVTALRVGMIPVIIPPGETAPYAHRITSISGTPHHPVVTTKGDANPVADQWHARLDANRVPVVVATAPDLGHVLIWIHGRAIRAALLCALGLLVTGLGTRIAMSTTRRPLARATT